MLSDIAPPEPARVMMIILTFFFVVLVLFFLLVLVMAQAVASFFPFAFILTWTMPQSR